MTGLRHISVMMSQDNSHTPQLLMCKDNIEGGISGCRDWGIKNLKMQRNTRYAFIRKGRIYEL